jgi:hypothetical protein
MAFRQTIVFVAASSISAVKYEVGLLWKSTATTT